MIQGELEYDKKAGKAVTSPRACSHSAQAKKHSRASNSKQGQTRVQIFWQISSDEAGWRWTWEVTESGSARDVARHTNGPTQARAQVWTQLPSKGEEATKASHSSLSHSSFHCSPIPSFLSMLYQSQPCTQVSKTPGSRQGVANSQGALTALT